MNMTSEPTTPGQYDLRAGAARSGRRGGSILFAAGITLLFCASFALAADLEQPPPVALDGYCPVCLVEMGKVIKGDPHYRSVRDGRTYYFPGPDQKKMFDKDPEKYIPAFRGNCIVCQVEMGETVPAKPELFTSIYSHLFLFATFEQKKMFDANPGKYVSATLAAGGKCVVCLAGGADTPGKRDLSAWYDGMRYQFPSEDMRKMFLDNPEKYVPAADGQCLVCKVDMGKNIEGKAEFSTLYNGRLYFFVGKDQVSMFTANPGKYLNAGADPKQGKPETAGSGTAAQTYKSGGNSAPGSSTARQPVVQEKRPSQSNGSSPQRRPRTSPSAGGSGSSR
jgi:YHS domain-containing protein